MRQDEERCQIAVVNSLRSYDDLIVFSVPNGGLRSKKAAARLKASGVLAGVSDLIILFRSGRCVFLEMKAENGKQSTAQKWFQKTVEYFGFDYHIIQTSNPYEAVARVEKIIKQYRQEKS